MRTLKRPYLAVYAAPSLVTSVAALPMALFVPAFYADDLGLPIAAVGMLNPMVAALAMAFSDVIVIGNSIRLKSKSLK